MTWLTLRQHRVQLAGMLAIALLLAIALDEAEAPVGVEPTDLAEMERRRICLRRNCLLTHRFCPLLKSHAAQLPLKPSRNK